MFLEERQQSCVSCPSTPPPCNCNSNQSCVTISRSCSACDSVKCIDKPSQSSSGPSTGALAGAITGIVILAVIVFAGYYWWRRRQVQSALRSEKSGKGVMYDVPASADKVLSRPDPIEKPLPAPSMRSTVSTAVPDNVSERSAAVGNIGASVLADPFADQASIQTTSARTHSPNVITIGLMPPPDGITALRPPPNGPIRPARSPDISLRSDDETSLNLAHVNVSNDSLQPPKAKFAHRQTQLSSMTYDSRTSFLSTSSSALDILTEAPTIVTPVQGAVRQVLGVVKAEVVQAPTTPGSVGHLPVPKSANRPGRSPLSQRVFGPNDVPDPNPFGDDKSPFDASRESVQSTTTFGARSPTQWTFPPTPTWPADSRPTSVASNAGTITADIGNARRVMLGMQSPATFSTTATAHTSIATLGSTTTISSLPLTPPPSAARLESDNDPNRLSQASMVSATSSRADSILEAFPFVPPSPIAARPPRSPGLTFSPPSPAKSTHSVSAQQAQPPPRPERFSTQSATTSSRKTLGMSTASAMSSSSGLSGLDSFTFKFSDAETPPLPQNSMRASLDTLALSRDLEAFPLPYDDPSRDSYAPSTK